MGFIGLLGLGSCAPVIGPGDIGAYATPPPGKSQVVFEYENRACRKLSKEVVQAYVQCMQLRGNRVQLFGPGGVALNVPHSTYQTPTVFPNPPGAIPETSNQTPSSIWRNDPDLPPAE